MQFNVQIKNLPQIRMALASEPRIMAHNLNEAIKDSSLAIRDSAKHFIVSGEGYIKAPFQTGKMYSQVLSSPVVNLTSEIYPTVDYAIYVHEGLSTSRKYGRRPFLEDAIEDRTEYINEQFEKAVENTLNNVASIANI